MLRKLCGACVSGGCASGDGPDGVLFRRRAAGGDPGGGYGQHAGGYLSKPSAGGLRGMEASARGGASGLRPQNTRSAEWADR